MQNHLLHNSFKTIKGILHFGGANVVQLAEKYGTPLYVYDQKRMKDNIRRLRNAFEKHYAPFRILYAVKANNNLHILKSIGEKVDGADASYSTEIQLAKKAEFKTISFSGNYLSMEELEFGLKNTDIINFDSINAFEKSLQYGIPQTITFRINPGIGKGSFKTNIFAGENAKFGIPHEQALEAYKTANAAGVQHFGIYMMTGSCVMDPEYFEIITKKLLETAGNIKKHLGIEFEFINIGGGFGIPYKPDEKPININQVAKNVTRIFKNQCKKHDFGTPTLIIEPGRYIVGDAGILLTRVHDIKQSYQRFAGVDAGMNVLLRPAMYDAYHHIVLANRSSVMPNEQNASLGLSFLTGSERRAKRGASAPSTVPNGKTPSVISNGKRSADESGSPMNICGQICENADILARDRLLPQLREGDTLAILCAGAYGYSMSSNYNTRPRPAEVLISNGKDRLIRKKETLNDMTRNIS